MKARTPTIGWMENNNKLDVEGEGTLPQLQYNGLICKTDKDKHFLLCLVNERFKPFTDGLMLKQVYTHESLHP